MIKGCGNGAQSGAVVLTATVAEPVSELTLAAAEETNGEPKLLCPTVGEIVTPRLLGLLSVNFIGAGVCDDPLRTLKFADFLEARERVRLPGSKVSTAPAALSMICTW